jgi:Oxidoreductase family, NAD-binding Rossmann fold
MELIKTLPNSEQAAVCDVYEPRLLQAYQIAGSGARQYKDYRELLDSKEIDAVVIGSPDHWHKQMTIEKTFTSRSQFLILLKRGRRWFGPWNLPVAWYRPAHSRGVGIITF